MRINFATNIFQQCMNSQIRTVITPRTSHVILSITTYGQFITFDTVTFFRVSIRVEKERVSRLPMTMLERSGCAQMDMLKPCLTMGTPPRTLQRPLMTQTATRRLVSVHCTSMCIVHHFWQPSHMGNIAII